MSKKTKILLGIAGFLMLFAVAFGVFFVRTGGMKLYYLYTNYLSKPIENKEFTWKDFTYKGVMTITSGYYAFSTSDRLCMWTFYGLKCFTPKPGASYYNFSDICAGVKALETEVQSYSGSMLPKDISSDYSLDTPNYENFRDYLAPGQFIQIRDFKDNGKKWIDKVISLNNPNYPIKEIKSSDCK